MKKGISHSYFQAHVYFQNNLRRASITGMNGYILLHVYEVMGFPKTVNIFLITLLVTSCKLRQSRNFQLYISRDTSTVDPLLVE